MVRPTRIPTTQPTMRPVFGKPELPLDGIWLDVVSDEGVDIETTTTVCTPMEPERMLVVPDLTCVGVILVALELSDIGLLEVEGWPDDASREVPGRSPIPALVAIPVTVERVGTWDA